MRSDGLTQSGSVSVIVPELNWYRKAYYDVVIVLPHVTTGVEW